MVVRPRRDAVAVDLRAGAEARPVRGDEAQAELLGAGARRAGEPARAGAVEDDDERTGRRAEERVGEAAAVGELEHGFALGAAVDCGRARMLASGMESSRIFDGFSQLAEWCYNLDTRVNSLAVHPRQPRPPAHPRRRPRLLAERPFAELTVATLMAEAGLARTVFYRHFDDLPSLAPELLPDSEDPLVDRIERGPGQAPLEIVRDMVDGLVDVFAEHGRLLRAIDDAAGATRPSPSSWRPRSSVRGRCSSACCGARRTRRREPAESARLLMATHRAYLLDTFAGERPAPPDARAAARTALLALWERLLAGVRTAATGCRRTRPTRRTPRRRSTAAIAVRTRCVLVVSAAFRLAISPCSSARSSSPSAQTNSSDSIARPMGITMNAGPGSTSITGRPAAA